MIFTHGYIKCDVRKDINNKRLWVVDVYYHSRPYPNVVSGRYITKKSLLLDLDVFIKTKGERFTLVGNC